MIMNEETAQFVATLDSVWEVQVLYGGTDVGVQDAPVRFGTTSVTVSDEGTSEPWEPLKYAPVELRSVDSDLAIGTAQVRQLNGEGFILTNIQRSSTPLRCGGVHQSEWYGEARRWRSSPGGMGNTAICER